VGTKVGAPEAIAVSRLCHGRISDGERYVGTVAGRIGYRAINVQESNPVAGSIDKT
jgi:hypothetical protein